MNRHRIGFGTMMVAVLLGAASCTVTRPPPPAAASGPIVWPSPPAEPRIAYARSFTGPADFGVAVSRWRRLVHWVTGLGGKSENFIKPFGVAFDEDDNICLTDTGAGVVVFIDRRARSCQRWAGVGRLRFVLPVAVARARGVFYVADASLKTVVAFDSRGRLLADIRQGLERPAGLALGGDRLYVADAVAHNIAVFDHAGKFLFRFGRRGTAPGEFNCPTHVATDAQGRVLVTDAMNGRLQLFTADGMLLGVISSAGDRPGQFGRPKGLAADRFGHIYAADALFDHIQVFDDAGRLLLTWGATGAAPGEFWLPEGVAISRANEILVADSYNQRVQMFNYIGAP